MIPKPIALKAMRSAQSAPLTCADKHVFVNMTNNTHMYAFLSVIVPKFLDPNNVVIFHKKDHPANDKYGVLERLQEKYDLSVLSSVSGLQDSKAIHFLSLTPENASCILDTITKCGAASKIHIILADDEVNRFYRCKQLYRRLRVSKRYKVDNDVIAVLAKVDNYFRENEPWGVTLENIVGRKLNMTNVVDFTPFEVIEGMIADKSSRRKRNGSISILQDSRPTGALQRLRFLGALMYAKWFMWRSAPLPEIDVYIWRIRKTNIAIQFIDKAIRVAINGKRNRRAQGPTVVEVDRMPYEDYVAFLSTIDIMPLGVRGGASGALLLSSQGGVVSYRKASFNDRCFSNYYCQDTQVRHSSYLGFFRNLSTSIESRDVVYESFVRGTRRYLEEKKKFYASFYGH